MAAFIALFLLLLASPALAATPVDEGEGTPAEEDAVDEPQPPEAPAPMVGDAYTFWCQDWTSGAFVPRVATAKYVGEHVAVYLENQAELSSYSISELGQAFDSVIYPVLTAAYGSEPNPGLDNDPRIVILIYDFNDPGNDTDGSFNPRDINPDGSSTSNAREMFFLNVESLHAQTGSGPRLAAHEFSHLLTYYHDVMLDPGPDPKPESTWVAEMFSTYGEHLCGYNERVDAQLAAFASEPNFSLTHWQGLRQNYGAAYSFMSYLADREGSEFVRALAQQPLDGAAGIDASLASRGSTSTFASLFDDWVLAAYLDRSTLQLPPYLFTGLQVLVQAEAVSGVAPLLGTREVTNYGALYIDFPIASPSKVFQAVLDGADGAPLRAALISWDSTGGVGPAIDRFDLANGATGDTVSGPLGYDRHVLAVWARGPVGSPVSYSLTFSGMTDPPGGIQFLDMGGSDPFYNEVGVLLDRGVVSGREVPYGSGLWFFMGKQNVLRAQFAKMIMEALELHTEGVDNIGNATFRDVPDTLFDVNGYPYDYVEEAAALGIVKGNGGYFSPYAPIKRSHLVLMIIRGAKAREMPLPRYHGDERIFADVPPSHPYYDEIMSAYAIGLFEGSPGPNGKRYFYPDSPASRNHVAKMTANLLAYLALR